MEDHQLALDKPDKVALMFINLEFAPYDDFCQNQKTYSKFHLSTKRVQVIHLLGDSRLSIPKNTCASQKKIANMYFLFQDTFSKKNQHQHKIENPHLAYEKH